MGHETDRECPKCQDGQLWFFYEWTDDGVDTSYVAAEFDPSRRDCACAFTDEEVRAMEERLALDLHTPSY